MMSFPNPKHQDSSPITRDAASQSNDYKHQKLKGSTSCPTMSLDWINGRQNSPHTGMTRAVSTKETPQAHHRISLMLLLHRFTTANIKALKLTHV
jgi:hypothetical protein